MQQHTRGAINNANNNYDTWVVTLTLTVIVGIQIGINNCIAKRLDELEFADAEFEDWIKNGVVPRIEKLEGKEVV